MLPLWIIDLRLPTDRRRIFQDLLGQIRHVYIPGSDKEETVYQEKESNATSNESPEKINDQSTVSTSTDRKIKTPASERMQEYDEPEEEEISVEEKIDASERRKAERESIIDGYWWRYSPMADKAYNVNIDSPDGPKKPEEVAECLYEFQSDLVVEGQKFIRGLRESNARPDIKLNVVVLGDIEEEFTRLLFPSVAGMLQKEKGRILPYHIHQGMEIIGMIYIPSNINTLKVDLRNSMQRTLKEIDVQHNVSDMRGYDHMMLYQDVQNRTECVYPALTDEQLEEYLIQCLIHLYLASDESHPLLSGTASAEAFYFSMGATAVCYDVENEDIKARHNFGLNFMRSIKKEGTDEKTNPALSILDTKDFDPARFFDYEALNHLDNRDVELRDPNPHPVKNFFNKYLKRYYYNRHLRNFTTDMMQQIRGNIEETTHDALEILASKSKQKFKDAKLYIHDRLKDIFADLSSTDGGLPTVIRLFREMQESLSQKKKSVTQVINTNFWGEVESKQVPSAMRDRFIDYHDAYEEDIRRKNGGTLQNEMKKEAVEELNGILSREAPILSRICRSILLGITLALALVPLLNIISPELLNLGRVRRYAEWWSLGIFFIPIVFQFLLLWRYNRSKRRAINNLKALFLHDAYARIANRMETEIKGFYDKIIALGDKYVKRTEKIRDEMEKGYQDYSPVKPVIPETTFCQPLLGGKFGHEGLLPTPDAENTIININYINYKTSEITDSEYYLFMNQHHNLLLKLYDDVEIFDNITRRPGPGGEEVLVTREQMESEQDDKWKGKLKEFQENLSETIKESIVPRINDTVGEILVNSIDSKIVAEDVLQPMVEYAANNGEITSSADLELTDVKVNDPRAIRYLFPFVSSAFKNPQVDKYNFLFKKYIFLTRWRCFDYFPLNRILPMEDFDEKVRSQLVYEEEQLAKHKRKDDKRFGKHKTENVISEPDGPKKEYFSYPSSLLLWALSPDDSSTEWFRLLDSDYFKEAYEEKEKYKEILNQND